MPGEQPRNRLRNCEWVSSAVGTGTHSALAAGEIFAGDEKRFDFLGCDAPRVAPCRNKVKFEILVVPQCERLVLRCVRQERERQLRRAAAAISPGKTCRAVVAQFKMQRQRSSCPLDVVGGI